MTKNKLVPLKDAVDAFNLEVAAALAESRMPKPIYLGDKAETEAVLVPAGLMEELLGRLEDADLADLITARKSAGDSRPLDELAESLGLDKSDYQ